MFAARSIAVFILFVCAAVGLSAATAQTGRRAAPPAGNVPMPAGEAAGARDGDAQALPGRVDAVTVYRGQALVTRVVELPRPAGLREVVVTELPEHVVPGSLYAESADGVEVRSVRYRTRPITHDVRDEVRELDRAIQDQQDRLRVNQRQGQLLNERKEYLTRLEQFTASTANVELARGVLDAETLTTLTDYLFQQRARIAEAELELATEEREIRQRIEQLQRERAQIAGRSSRTVREAVVFVNQTAPNATLRLRYMVNQANWSPSYNARAEAGGGQVLVEYQAAVQQMSGEDWGDVRMTLSTATPSLVANAPALNR
jgi:uncharacterized protein (TIGR02231 family)